MEQARSQFSAFPHGHAALGIARVNRKNNQCLGLRIMLTGHADIMLNRFITSDLLLLAVGENKRVPIPAMDPHVDTCLTEQF